MKITEFDVLTGEQTTRDLTADEIAALPAPEPRPDPRASVVAARSAVIAAAARAGWIGGSDAVGWAQNTLPPSVQAAVQTLPAADQIGATLRLLMDQDVARLDPAILAWAQTLNRTEADTDALFGVALGD